MNNMRVNTLSLLLLATCWSNRPEDAIPSPLSPETTAKTFADSNSGSRQGFSWGTIVLATIVGIKGTKMITRYSWVTMRGLLKNPLMAAGVGIVFVAPILDETLFADEPNLNAKCLTMNIVDRWKIQKDRARKNSALWKHQLGIKYDGTTQELKDNYPAIYNGLIALTNDPNTQQAINETKKVGASLKTEISTIVNSFSKWFSETPKREKDTPQDTL